MKPKTSEEAFANLMACMEAKKRVDSQLEAASKDFLKFVPEEALQQILGHLGMKIGEAKHFCDRPYKGDNGIVRCRRDAGHTGKHGQGKRGPKRKRRAPAKKRAKQTKGGAKLRRQTCKKAGCSKDLGHGGAHTGRAHHSKQARPRPKKRSAAKKAAPSRAAHEPGTNMILR